jgi:muramoyltetrapeptide carboxypeptidase
MKRFQIIPEKPRPLRKGARIGVFSIASPAERSAMLAGLAELQRLGFEAEFPAQREPQGYFAGTPEERLKDFCAAVHNKNLDGLIATRGGYGSNYLIEHRLATRLQDPKCLMGFSDLTSIEMLLWQVRRWVTFYGPMVAAGFNHGAGKPGGYDEASFLEAVRHTGKGWKISLQGDPLVSGEAEGRLVGGCLTLLQTALGTSWQLDARGAILVMEDCGMKPYQLDRVLMHMKYAGQFNEVSGFVLGDFPDCDPPQKGSPTVREVCERVLRPLGVPIVYGAPVGHTKRALLTLPLGVKAKLHARDEGKLEILEAAVAD